MNLSVNWPNAAHFLLQNPTVTLEVDGTPAVAAMRPGGADFVVPKGSASPPIATLTVTFAPTFAGPSTQTLRVVQNFALMPPLVFGGGGPLASTYTVRPKGTAADVTLVGQHPLVANFSALGLWFVKIDTSVVDVTTVQPLLLKLLNKLSRPATQANVSVLARTDGKVPRHWITATPPSSTSFANTDVLCFLTPPQDSPKIPDDTPARFTTPRGIAQLSVRAGIFLPRGKHDNTLPGPARDHFSPARAPTDAGWPNKETPNVVLPRGWESALMASGRHVALAMPVPANGSHNGAGTAALPALLSGIHGTLVAIGDIAGPDGSILSLRPLLGVAAHSNGGPELFKAVAASPQAFKEIWLFDTEVSAKNLVTLATAGTARVLFAGFDSRPVVTAHTKASGMASLKGRIRRLPDPPLPPKATPAALAASSRILTHALEGGGLASPASSWTPGEFLVVSTGEKFRERFEILHQQIVQGNDADGFHYLTKALTGSVFR